MKKNLFLVFLLIYFLLPQCNKDPELEKIKSILSKDSFQLKNFPPIGVKPYNDRIMELPDRILKNLIQSDTEYYMEVNYENYTLNINEKNVFLDALNHLPEKYKQVLDKKLIGFYFIKNYTGGGSANWLVDENNNIYYFIILNSELFSKTTTEWEVKKNGNLFCTNSDLQFKIKFGDKPAIYNLLFHEVSHVIDMEYRITPYISNLMKQFLMKIRKEKVLEPTPFTAGVWADFNQLQYREPELARDFNFYNNMKDNKCLNSYEIPEIYFAFLNSNVASLYSTKNWVEDFAELSSIYLMNKNFKSQYKVEVVEKGKTLFEYHPLKNEIIQSRIKLIEEYLE